MNIAQEGRGLWHWWTADPSGHHDLGWFVTIVGFVIAARVTRAGWARTAEAALAA